MHRLYAKTVKNFWGGAQPLPKPLPAGEGKTPSPDPTLSMSFEVISISNDILTNQHSTIRTQNNTITLHSIPLLQFLTLKAFP